MEAKRGRCHVGTSGWSYDHWHGPFYPPELRPGDRLAHYARHFASVEVNGTFYRLPGMAAVRQWVDDTPDGFVFSVKASRFITHMKKLKDPEASLPPFLDCIGGLGNKLGPVLFQLPPRWRVNLARLDAFLVALPNGLRTVFEFRDPSWLDDAVLTALAGHGAGFCIFDLAGTRTPAHVTAAFVYIRLHGPGGAYQGRYGHRRLAAWAADIDGWISEGRDVYCYFDNDEAGHAVADARTLAHLVGAGPA